MINDTQFKNLLLIVNELDSEQIGTLYNKVKETWDKHKVANVQNLWNGILNLLDEINQIFPNAWVCGEYRIKDLWCSTYEKPDWLESEDE